MLSPFPGMDPYLEELAIWPGFETALFVELKRVLNRILPPGYIAKIDRYVWIHEQPAQERLVLGNPDTYVVQNSTHASTQSTMATVEPPSTIVLPSVRKERNRYLKILDPKCHRVVTVVEVLSPTNKYAGIDRESYLLKRNEYFATGVNVIEIDLLRAGQRMPWGDTPPPERDYYVMVCRASEFPRAGIWALSVRDPLPTIPVPLDLGIAEPQLSLKDCFNNAFEDGRHAVEIDYAQPAIPPMKEPDAAWACEVLAHRSS